MNEPERTTVKYAPRALRKIDEQTLGITWSDGVESAYPVRYLRQQCPCAKCVDEMTGVRTLDPESIGPDVRPVEIEPVGKYAFNIAWSDGHGTGIYTFHYLRQLDPARSDEASDAG